MWKTTDIHITADGAANRLFAMFPDNRVAFIPDFIIVCC